MRSSLSSISVPPCRYSGIKLNVFFKLSLFLTITHATSNGTNSHLWGFINIESALSDTFSLGLLDYPHYTQPRIIDDKEVPEVLVSGHHEKIESWRQSHRESRTRDKRPDLWEKYKKIRKSE